MGPAVAAAAFRKAFPKAVRFEADLYGSLAATGRGHFTDRALEGELGAEGALEGGLHLVSFDTVIRTMVQTGHDLPSLYRETSTGGLSLYVGLAADPAAE